MTRVVAARVAALRHGRSRAQRLGDGLRVGVAVKEVAEADAAHLTWSSGLGLARLGGDVGIDRYVATVAVRVSSAKRERWERPADAVGGKGAVRRCEARSGASRYV